MFRNRRLASRSVSPRGFTLIELLIVITVIGVLIALLLPAVQAARDSARRYQCANNLKQIGLALLNYHAHRKALPPGYVSEVSATGVETGPGWGWLAQLLPHLEQSALASSIDYRQPIESPVNQAAREQLVPTLLCPSNELVTPTWPAEVRDAAGSPLSEICQVAFCPYMGVYGSSDTVEPGDGLFFRNSKVRFQDIHDGTSKTLAVGERSYNLGDATWVGAVTGASMYPDSYDKKIAAPYMKPSAAMILSHTGYKKGPNAKYSHLNQFFSLHRTGVNFLYADGHVVFMPETIDYVAYRAMATRSGGEVAPAL